MCKSQRGFTLPIVSAIIGFIAAMSSAIFPTFFHNAKQSEVVINQTASSTATAATSSRPVSAQVARSQTIATSTGKQKSSAPVRQITRTMDAQTAQACQDSQKISTPSGSPASPLTGYIRELCKQLSEPSPDTQVQTDAWKATEKNVQEKWAILQKSKATANTTPPVQAEVPVSPYKTSLETIDAFLANPTPSALKEFCMKAKQLPGYDTYEGLDSSRTSMIQYTNTLYTDAKWCRYVLNEGGYDPKAGHFTFMYYDSSFLLPLTNPNDSDATRKLQILYNQTVEAVGRYGLIGYESDMAGGSDPGGDKRPDVAMTTILNMPKGGSMNWYINSFIRSLMAPVEELTKIRQQYPSNL